MGQNGVPGYSLMRDYFNHLFIISERFPSPLAISLDTTPADLTRGRGRLGHKPL